MMRACEFLRSKVGGRKDPEVLYNVTVFKIRQVLHGRPDQDEAFCGAIGPAEAFGANPDPANQYRDNISC